MKMNRFGRIATMFAAVLLASSTMTSCGPDEPKETIPAAAGDIQGPTEVQYGESIELTVDEIKGAKTYKWFKNGSQVQNKADRILNVTTEGDYTVAGVNSKGTGEMSSVHTVIVIGAPNPPAAAGTISGPTEVNQGETITLTIDVIERAETYKWYKNGAMVQNTDSRELEVSEGGVYKVAGVNADGEGTASANHTVTFIAADVMPGENQWAYFGELIDMDPMAEYDDINMQYNMGTFIIYDIEAESYIVVFVDSNSINNGTITSTSNFGLRYVVKGTTVQNDDAPLSSIEASVSVDYAAETIAITANAVFPDGNRMRINYESDFTFGLPAPETTPITSIDQLVGNWNAAEQMYIYDGDVQKFVPYNVGYTVGITKVNDTTLDIRNFTGGSNIYSNTPVETIRVTLDGNLNMVIPTNAAFSTPWETGTTTIMVPLMPDELGNMTFSDGYNQPFPTQPFGVQNDGTVVMRSVFGYAVGVIKNGSMTGAYCYAPEGMLVWKKAPAAGAPAYTSKVPMGIRKPTAMVRPNINKAKKARF